MTSPKPGCWTKISLIYQRNIIIKYYSAILYSKSNKVFDVWVKKKKNVVPWTFMFSQYTWILKVSIFYMLTVSYVMLILKIKWQLDYFYVYVAREQWRVIIYTILACYCFHSYIISPLSCNLYSIMTCLFFRFGINVINPIYCIVTKCRKIFIISNWNFELHDTHDIEDYIYTHCANFSNFRCSIK